MFNKDKQNQIVMEQEKEINRLREEYNYMNRRCKQLERLVEVQNKIIDILESENDKNVKENPEVKEDTEVSDDTEVSKDLLELFLNRQTRIFKNKENHGFNTTNIYQEARYILEEVAELMRAIEKHDDENMKEELADIVIFAYGCAEVAKLGDLDTKIFEKMRLNEKRVYTKTKEGDFVKSNYVEDK